MEASQALGRGGRECGKRLEAGRVWGGGGGGPALGARLSPGLQQP